jgi:hypothetical protein
MTAEEYQHAIDCIRQAQEAVQRALCALCSCEESIDSWMEQKLNDAETLIEEARDGLTDLDPAQWDTNS